MKSISHFINSLKFEEKAAIDSLITVKNIRKGDVIEKKELSKQNTFYVKKGLLRKFTIVQNKEYTLDFYFTDEIYFPTSKVEPIREQVYFLQAETESILFEIDYSAFETQKKNHIVLMQLENLILENAAEGYERRVRQFQTMNATERYKWLIEEKSEYFQFIPLKHIASYLGVNNAALSKIRASFY